MLSSMRRYLLLALLILAPLATQAQWQILDARTTADLRGIDNVGKGVVWASGTNGTVLRSEDDGYMWQGCTIPPGAEHLDFRGIQAFDNNTAIVMSSGKGDQSRLYKTTDGCQTWTLLFTNPDKNGFWDAIQMVDAKYGWMIGDPVHDHFVVGTTVNSGQSFSFLTTTRDDQETNESGPLKTSGHGAFAASNSALLVASPKFSAGNRKPFGTPCDDPILWFGTGGPGGAKLYRFFEHRPQCSDYGTRNWTESDTPLAGDTSSAGIFSLASASVLRLIAVGGDYLKPSSSTRTAAFTTDGGKTWQTATTPPHGYRSAVAYDPATETWITVGPNGTDISTDDGRNWHALKPDPKFNDPHDADQHWNALSLPFVVGPHGRIGMLRPDALNPNAKSP
jgi:photosystem II stability/assembly factor-like uncharacterized protein